MVDLLDMIAVLASLTFLEIVLGIDNLIFISLIVNRVPEANRDTVRFLGYFFAFFFRVILLASINWLTHLTAPIMVLGDFIFSYRDLLLGAGGVFLIYKSNVEMHEKVVHLDDDQAITRQDERKFGWFSSVFSGVSGLIAQVILVDAVFSLDSILTAVALTDRLMLMVVAVGLSLFVMALFTKFVSRFIDDNPSIQILALAFLLLIGFMLVLEAVHIDVPKPYIYFALGFSLAVEMLNLRLRRKQKQKIHATDSDRLR